MISIYEVYSSIDGVWADPDGSSGAILRDKSGGATTDLVWHLPMVRPTDVTWYSGHPVIRADGDQGTNEILSRSAEMLPLSGEANGWLLWRGVRKSFLDEERCYRDPKQQEFLVEEARRLGLDRVPKAKITKFRFFEDLLEPNTIQISQEIPGLLAIEDESGDTNTDDPGTCGLRAWSKAHNITGVRFKKMWDSTDTHIYDPGWFYDSLKPGYDGWD